MTTMFKRPPMMSMKSQISEDVEIKELTGDENYLVEETRSCRPESEESEQQELDPLTALHLVTNALKQHLADYRCF